MNETIIDTNKSLRYNKDTELNTLLNLDNVIHSKQNCDNRLTMTVHEMAQMMQISLPTAYKLANDRNFPSFKIGKRLLISYEGLQEWISCQCRGGK